MIYFILRKYKNNLLNKLLIALKKAIKEDLHLKIKFLFSKISL